MALDVAPEGARRATGGATSSAPPPDPEVAAAAKRRQFSSSQKRRILADAEPMHKARRDRGAAALRGRLFVQSHDLAQVPRGRRARGDAAAKTWAQGRSGCCRSPADG